MNRVAKASLALLFAAASAGCGRGTPRIRTILKLAQQDARGVVTGVARIDGELWIGSWEGLTRLAGGKSAVFAAAAGLEKGFAQVRAVHAKGEILWLATGGGVAEFSTKAGKVVRTWTAKDGLGAESVRCVAEGRGMMWAGTIFGASRLRPGEKRWKNYRIAQGLSQDHVYALADDGKTLWASCINGGLVRFDAARDRWQAVPQEQGLGNRHIYALLPAPPALWLGTAGGVNLYHADTAHWDAAVCDDGFTDYCVRALALKGNRLWFGTQYGLFCRDLKTGKQRVYTRANGLPDDEVTAIVPDGEGFLVATKTGVAELIPPR